MKIAKEIFEKATIRGLADYLLFGLAPDPDERDYKARLDESYKKFEKAAFRHDSDGASNLLDFANDMTCETACVYFEIGIQAGILFIVDMFKNIERELHGENEEYYGKSRSMQQDIKKVLDIIIGESEENENIKKACEILKNWEKPKAKRQGEVQ